MRHIHLVKCLPQNPNSNACWHLLIGRLLVWNLISCQLLIIFASQLSGVSAKNISPICHYKGKSRVWETTQFMIDGPWWVLPMNSSAPFTRIFLEILSSRQKFRSKCTRAPWQASWCWKCSLDIETLKTTLACHDVSSFSYICEMLPFHLYLFLFLCLPCHSVGPFFSPQWHDLCEVAL